MSSILDALEKANRERAAREGRDAAAGSAGLGQESARERRLREESEQSRRNMRVIVLCALAFAFLAGIGSFLYFSAGAAGRGASATEVPPPQPPAEKPAALPPQPVPTPVPATPAPTATPAPSTTPMPSPTAWPTPTPWPSPTMATAAPPTAEPTLAAVASPRPTGYRGLFKDGQVIGVSDVGLKMEGLLEKDSGNIAVINGQRIRAGQKVGDLHIVDIQPGVLTIDVGDAVVKARF